MYSLEEEAGSADCTEEWLITIRMSQPMSFHGRLVSGPERAQLANVSDVLSMTLPNVRHHGGSVSEPPKTDATSEWTFFSVSP